MHIWLKKWFFFCFLRDNPSRMSGIFLRFLKTDIFFPKNFVLGSFVRMGTAPHKVCQISYPLLLLLCPQ